MRQVTMTVSLALLLFAGARLSQAQGRADFQGQPTLFHQGAEASYWIWQDEVGYHLRTTTAHDRRNFSGRVVFTGEAGWVKGYQVGPNDEVRITNEGVHFHFATQRNIEGFDFRLSPGTTATFYLDLDGNSGPKLREKVFIGSENVHPQAIPFSVSYGKSE